ncbi:sensor domain-containing diguanylate cyclase [Oceanobacter kriegii]|uniref:sensor domain-containing diguanylate cyclase n=1 Tax=Oceanobacter kriegii TaxID=64972 RepID=UPI000409A4D2|nr:diguanylate cyclase [Oceanobacter kriegii]
MLIISAIYAVVFLVGVLLVRAIWIYPQELEHSRNLQQQELLTIQHLIELPQTSLEQMAADYSDRYKVVDMLDRRVLSHIFDLFSPEVMQQRQLSHVLLLRPDGETLAKFTLMGDEQELSFRSAPEWIFDWINQWQGDKPVSTIRKDRFGVGVYAATPVWDEPGHVNVGWLVFRSPLDDQAISQISRYSRVPLQIIDTSDHKIQPTSLTAAVDRAANLRQRCIVTDGGQVPLCLQIQHNDTVPEFGDLRLLTTLLIAMLLPFALWWILARLIVAPVEKITELLESNSREGLLKPILFAIPLQMQELVKLKQAYNRLIGLVMRQQHQLQELSTTDSLTRIPNRLAFDRALAEGWSRIQRRKTSIAIVMLDIDYFKPYNDHYGHPAGDAALTKVAAALVKCAQRTDEIVARYGGEEFAMIIHIDDAIELNNFRRRLKQAIRDLEIPHQYSQASSYLTISAGVAWIVESGEWLQQSSPREWMKAADVALYEAKAAGRNCTMIQILDRTIKPRLPDMRS